MKALPRLYHPIGRWTGRLILPTLKQRRIDGAVLIEIHNAAPDYADLVGQVVPLCWSSDPEVQSLVQAVTHDVEFNHWTALSQAKGNLHPERINGWWQVNPLESLAGARHQDDVVVLLRDAIVALNRDGERSLIIHSEPVQITGRVMALVSVVEQKAPTSEYFWVSHFNQSSKLFDGPLELVRIPQAAPDRAGICRSTHYRIERSPLNSQGWYVYGEHDAEGVFVVQAIEPRAITQLKPDEVRLGYKAASTYLYRDNWKDAVVQKGTAKTVLVSAGKSLNPLNCWQEGDAAIVVHLYGGIGGKKGEKAPFGLVLGHFAYGIARVIRDPLTNDLRFDIEYKQVYGHNPDGIISGTIKWSSYAGDLQRGWLGNRPISDVLIKLDAVTQDYDFDGIRLSPLTLFNRHLEAIAACYRTGHGTGAAFINPATSCVQDSNQALYLTIKKLQGFVRATPQIGVWLQRHPNHPQRKRFRQLMSLGQILERSMVPFGIAHPDWRRNVVKMIKTRNVHNLLEMLLRALLAWRTIVPFHAHDAIVHIFLKQGSLLWFIRTNQVGGEDPDIEPRAPRGFLGPRD